MNTEQQLKTSLFNETNRIRGNAKLSLLYFSPELGKLGQLHSEEMNKYNFFDHVNRFDPKLQTLGNRVQFLGLERRLTLVGENLADFPFVAGNSFMIFPGFDKQFKLKNTSELATEILAGWLNSPGHRANLLHPHFNRLGFGLILYKKDSNGYKVPYVLATQIFGTFSH